MFKRVKEDKVILVITLALVAFGLLMVYSASSVMALRKKGDSFWFLKRQAVWVAMGLSAMFAAWMTDYRKLKKPALPALGLIALMLVAVLVPGLGAEVNGAKRWIRLAGLSVQPSEFLKPVLLVTIAASLAKRSDRMSEFWFGVGPYLMMTGMFASLILMEPDLGTAVTLFAVVVSMIFVAGMRLTHLGYMVAAALPVIYYELFHVGFRLKRLLVYLDPWQDPLGKGFQAIQSFLAFGGGGLTGMGLGESRQKLMFLPEPHSDFIFSVIGEEFGLVGSMAVAVCYMVFTLCGIRLALRCEEPFGRVLAFGLTVMIGLQSIINMGVATGLFPNKGMPLPFVSAGGSSVLVALASVGILLSIARNGKGEDDARSMQAR